MIDMSDGIETLDAYSVDISLEENPTAVKWRHHFNEDGSIPGLDSQVGEDARSIGYWSGCYYHAERCFRSSYNSIMNNLGVYAEELALQYKIPLVRMHEGSGGSVGGNANKGLNLPIPVTQAIALNATIPIIIFPLILLIVPPPSSL